MWKHFINPETLHKSEDPADISPCRTELFLRGPIPGQLELDQSWTASSLGMHSLGEKLYSKKLKQKSQPQDDWCGLDFKDERGLVFKYEPTLILVNFLLLPMVQLHWVPITAQLSPWGWNSVMATPRGCCHFLASPSERRRPLSLISISEKP